MTTRRGALPHNGDGGRPTSSSGAGVNAAPGTPVASPSSLRALSSSLLAGRGLFGLLDLPLDGLSYNGRRDLYQAFGFPRYITASQYNARYRRGGIAHRIIEVYPRAIWGGGVDIVEDQDPDNVTPFEEACISLFERLLPVIMRADKLANIAQYSVILIGAPGELSTPLPRMHSLDEIGYFQSYGQNRARITKLNIDPSSPLFGTPEEYTLSIGVADGLSVATSPLYSSGLTGQSEVKVHASRIIHVAEGCLEDNIYGQPRLECVWNLLDSLDKVIHGGGEQSFRGGNPPTFVNLDPTTPVQPDQEQAMDQEIDDMINGFQSYSRLMGAQITVTPMRVPQIKDNAAAIMEQIGGALAIPQRELAGSEAGHLASTQDVDNFDAQKDVRKREFGGPLIRTIIDRLVAAGAMPAPKNESYEVVWPSNRDLNETERATVTNSLATANFNQVRAEGKPILTSDEIREKIWELEPLEQESQNQDNNEEGNGMDEVVQGLTPDDGDMPTPNDSVSADKVGTLTSRRLSLLLSSPLPSERIVILGGPRCGKSTLSQHFRNNGIPTYCGDPASKVKDVEAGVTYLPEGLGWSEASQYIAEKWLTMEVSAEGTGWCCEGIAMVRALRKWLELIDYDPVKIQSLRVIYLKSPVVNVGDMESGQRAMVKAVETIWQGIKEWFPQVEVVSEEASVNAEEKGGNISLAMGDVIRPLRDRDRIITAAQPYHATEPLKPLKASSIKSAKVTKPTKPAKPVKQHGFTGLRVAIKSPTRR